MNRSLARATVIRALLAGLVWVVLTGGSTYNWGFALLVVAAAVASSLYMLPAGAWHWTVSGFLLFFPHFLKQSILGGIDVSMRAFNPRMRLRPGVVAYQLRLPDGPERVFFANSVSLQPGSVVMSIEGDTLYVHALDTGMPIGQTLCDLEVRVAALFGVTFPAAP